MKRVWIHLIEFTLGVVPRYTFPGALRLLKVLERIGPANHGFLENVGCGGPIGTSECNVSDQQITDFVKMSDEVVR